MLIDDLLELVRLVTKATILDRVKETNKRLEELEGGDK